MEAAVFGFLVVLALASFAGARARRVKLPRRWFLLGDSHVEGLAVSLGARAREQSIPFQMFAVRGSSARDWRRTHLRAALEFNAHELVFVSLGANDCASVELAAEFFGNLRVLLERLAQAKRVAVLLLPPAACGDIRRAMEQLDAPLLILPPENLKLFDGVHLFPEGYTRWSQKIASSVLSSN